MPTARELLEQADALMRRNRERAVNAGFPRLDPEVPEVKAATPGLAAEIPEIPELTDFVTIGAPLARPTTLNDMPELVDAIDEIEMASIAGLSVDAKKPSAVPDLDRGDHHGEIPVAESVGAAPPVLPERAPEPERAVEPEPALESAPVSAPEPELAPESTPALAPEPERVLEPELALEPAPAPERAPESKLVLESAPAPAPTPTPEPECKVGVELAPESAPPAPRRESRRLWSLFSFGRKPSEPTVAVPSVLPEGEGTTAATLQDETIAAAPAVDTPAREAPATDVAEVTSPAPIDSIVPASALPVEAQGSIPPPSTPPPEDAVVPPDAAKPVPADDWARWEALAEEIRMQVLQRIDIFTDTRLREQLAVQLQPIVDRASAELVTTINDHVGKLIRAYIAEAIEREIETWRKGNS